MAASAGIATAPQASCKAMNLTRVNDTHRLRYNMNTLLNPNSPGHRDAVHPGSLKGCDPFAGGSSHSTRILQ